MKKELRDRIWDRAVSTCEYCRMANSYDPLPFAIDHIRPQYHHGMTVAVNLALACFQCNTFKGTNVAGYDPDTDELTPLFNPRTHAWDEHFRFDGPEIIGTTAIGRTTCDVLRMNTPDRVAFRQQLIDEGVSF